ncbi:MAG: DUF6522 family protein [Roseovarius sp.]
MKIDMSQGHPQIDAQDLGRLLGLPPKEVQAKMRAGDITSRYETGEGEDAGRFRLTFYYNAHRLRLTCAEDGEVLSTIRVPQGRP